MRELKYWTARGRTSWLLRLVVSALLLCALPAQARRADFIKSLDEGAVNWSAKTATVVGRGLPDFDAPNVTMARVAAERAAKLDGYRRLLAIVERLYLFGDVRVGDVLRRSSSAQASVDRAVRGAAVLDTKYFSDGGVDVVLQVSLAGPITAALIPELGKEAVSDAPADRTGIVVDARGLALSQGLAPRLVRADGTRVFGAEWVAESYAESLGVVGYSTDMQAALADARVGENPLVIKAVGASGVDAVISAGDSARLQTLRPLMRAAKVILVVDTSIK